MKIADNRALVAEKKLYLEPSTTLVSIQFSSICKISSITGGDLNLGGDGSGSGIDPY